MPPAEGPGPATDAPFRLIDGHLHHGDVLISLTPTERAVLGALINAGGRPVAAEALIAAGWGKRAVGSESLHRCISTLRAKLTRVHQGPTIQTHHRVGYSLAVAVARSTSPAAPQGRQSAIELYRLATEIGTQRTKPALELALARLERAIIADPDFLPAQLLTGHVLIALMLHRYAPPRVTGFNAVELCDRILARFPGTADALSARGFVRVVVFADVEGFADLDAAIAREPQHWLLRLYRAWARAGAGDFAATKADLEDAWTFNPGGPGLVGSYAYLLFCAGEPEKALERLRAAEATTRFAASAHSSHALVASWLGFHDEAIAAGRRAADVLEGSPTMAASLAYSLARAGEASEAAGLVARLTADEETPPAPSMIAPVHLALGDEAKARTALAKADEELCAYRQLARSDPRLAALKRR